jgi:hypothetical protein
MNIDSTQQQPSNLLGFRILAMIIDRIVYLSLLVFPIIALVITGQVYSPL